jgi:hypothetical protein
MEKIEKTAKAWNDSMRKNTPRDNCEEEDHHDEDTHRSKLII